MKIFSWNINGIRAVEKKGNLAKFLSVKNPDIACFQEIKIDQSQISKENFDEKYPEYFKFYSHAERKGYAGTAIWSKQKPQAILRNFPQQILSKFNLADSFGDSSTEGRICAARFTDFWLITVYTPNTKNDLGRLKLRENWDAAFLEFSKGLEKGEFSEKDFGKNLEIINKKFQEIFSKTSVIFCGDLNVAHKEIDLSNPKSNRGKHGFTDEERQGFSNFISADLVDIFRIQNPEKAEVYTWWSHFAKSRERNVGWRIDYFVVSKDLNSQKNKAEVHNKILGSDHCPISLEVADV